MAQESSATLRLLHTADWHLGHSLHGHDRTYEHRLFLSWLADVIVAEQIDVLLIAGDVFDGANPPAYALSMYYEFLADLGKRSAGLDIIVVGGNHDSAARLNAPRALLSAIGVTVVGGITRDQGVLDIDRLLIPIHNRSGQVAGLVAALPFMRASDLRICDSATGDPLVEGVREVYSQVVGKALSQLSPTQPLIATGHCYMVGTQLSELSERRVLGGNQHALPVDIFAKEIAYVALGHLHKAQRVGWQDSIRYSGSCIPLSMAEAEYKHQVVVAEFRGNQLSDWRGLAIPRSVEMLRLRHDGVEATVSALASLPELEDANDLARPFLEVGVQLRGPVANLREQIENALQGKRARLVKIHATYLGDHTPLAEFHVGRRLAELQPRDVLRRRYKKEYEGDLSPELLAAFDELLDELGQTELGSIPGPSA